MIPRSPILAEGYYGSRAMYAKWTLSEDFCLVHTKKGELRGPGFARSVPRGEELGANSCRAEICLGGPPAPGEGPRRGRFWSWLPGESPGSGLQGKGRRVQHILGFQEAASRKLSARARKWGWERCHPVGSRAGLKDQGCSGWWIFPEEESSSRKREPCGWVGSVGGGPGIPCDLLLAKWRKEIWDMKDTGRHPWKPPQSFGEISCHLAVRCRPQRC